MGELAKTIEHFLAESRNEWASPAAERDFQKLQKQMAKAKQPDLDCAAALVAESLAEWSGPPLGTMALLLGSLVESGADPAPHSPLLVTRVKAMLGPALVMARAIQENFPETPEEEELDDSAVEAEESELEEAFESAVIAASAKHPEEAAACEGFNEVALATIAHLSRSAPARAAARRDRALLDAARELANEPEPPAEAKFLATMLHVLDGEPALVLHPESGRGFDVTLSGIARNFELHTLLAAELARPLGLAAKGPSKAVLACIRGEGPQCVSAVSAGVFNLHHWTALRRDGSLMEGQDEKASEHWIWNEGVPADIRPFEGRRVIVIGPAPYERTWNTNRTFDALRASVAVTRELSKDETAAWVRKLARAPRPKEALRMHGGP